MKITKKYLKSLIAEVIDERKKIFEINLINVNHKNLKLGDNVLIDDTKKFDYDNLHNLESGKIVKINTNFSADVKLDYSKQIETCAFDIIKKTKK